MTEQEVAQKTCYICMNNDWTGKELGEIFEELIHQTQPLIKIVHFYDSDVCDLEHHLACSGESEERPFAALINYTQSSKYDGAELCKRLKQRDSGIYIMGTSGHVNGKRAFLNAGADEFLEKPVEFEKIHVTIESALRYNF